MRRMSGVLLAGTMILALSALSWTTTARAAGEAQEGEPPQQKLTFNGDTVLWTVAIRPDRTADFEQILSKLREGLRNSEMPERRRQAEGWKVLRIQDALPDGNVAYVHMINPVVPGADYTIMQILYDEFPEERQQLYDLYRGAFAQNLSLATGNVAVDFTR